MASIEPTDFTWVTDPKTGRRTKKPDRDTTWRARYRDPKTGSRSKTFARKMDAEQFLALNRTAINEGDWVDPALRKSRFDEWAQTWWKTTSKLAPSTRRGYERILRVHILSEYSGRPVGSIEWMEVELYVNRLVENGHSPKTIRHIVSILSLIFKTAVRAKVLKENPASNHHVQVRRLRPTILSMSQVHHLIENTDDRYKTAVWLLVLAGLRTSELCGLRVCDIDWERSAITINEVQMLVTGVIVVKGPKTESGTRTIPLPMWLMEELRVQITSRETKLDRTLLPAERVFVSPTGLPLTDGFVWKLIDASQTKADLPRFRPYDLRHSHASLLIELGAHPKAISERMGHSEIGVTMNVYGHLFEGAQRRLTDDLNGLVDRTRKPSVGAEETSYLDDVK